MPAFAPQPTPSTPASPTLQRPTVARTPRLVRARTEDDEPPKSSPGKDSDRGMILPLAPSCTPPSYCGEVMQRDRGRRSGQATTMRRPRLAREMVSPMGIDPESRVAAQSKPIERWGRRAPGLSRENPPAMPAGPPAASHSLEHSACEVRMAQVDSCRLFPRVCRFFLHVPVHGLEEARCQDRIHSSSRCETVVVELEQVPSLPIPPSPPVSGFSATGERRWQQPFSWPLHLVAQRGRVR